MPSYAPTQYTDYAAQYGLTGGSTAGGPMNSQQKRVFTGNPFGSGGYADEQPLCEELGVNFQHIFSKSKAVLTIWLRQPDRHIMDDTDLAGPVLFCIAFGWFLLLSSGRVQFGYIYGLAVVGWLMMYSVLNLMSDSGIDGSRTASVLGYSLLPMVLLSIIATLLKLTGSVGGVLSVLAILWCTYSASTMFVTVLSMRDQRWLVAYPVGLFYAFFALLTVF